MAAIRRVAQSLGAAGRRSPRLGRRLRTPSEIQSYLNRLPYDDAKGTRSPYWVAREKKANCFEGALFAAAALRRLGFPPLVVDLHAVNDDDHVIAVFRRGGRWGAVAKSNTTTLRYREPVYRSLRELVMSYFDGYFNLYGVKSLRSYSRPLDLTRFDARDWMTTGEDLDWIGEHLNKMRHVPLVSPVVVRGLRRVDKDQIKAGFLSAVWSGLYKPNRR